MRDSIFCLIIIFFYSDFIQKLLCFNVKELSNINYILSINKNKLFTPESVRVLSLILYLLLDNIYSIVKYCLFINCLMLILKKSTLNLSRKKSFFRYDLFSNYTDSSHPLQSPSGLLSS